MGPSYGKKNKQAKKYDSCSGSSIQNFSLYNNTEAKLNWNCPAKSIHAGLSPTGFQHVFKQTSNFSNLSAAHLYRHLQGLYMS